MAIEVNSAFIKNIIDPKNRNAYGNFTIKINGPDEKPRGFTIRNNRVIDVFGDFPPGSYSFSIPGNHGSIDFSFSIKNQ